MMTISEYLNKEFLKWEKSTGERQTYKTFSNYLDVPYTTFSGWRNNNIRPSGENLRKLASKLGDEIYAILGEDPPEEIVSDPFLRTMKHTIRNLQPGERTSFVTAALELAEVVAQVENPEDYDFTIRNYGAIDGPVIEVKRKA